MIKLLTKKEEVIKEVSELKKEQKRIGFVPTMGSLHDGHLSLINQCKKDNNITVCSIFVNPAQFNEKQDYSSYPRMVEEDISRLEENECDIVFCPDVTEIYPDENYNLVSIDLDHLNDILESRFRKGHFQGVVTVVKKLFDIVKPHKAYFGQKDYQQFLVIKKLVEAFNYDIELVMCPIVREKDGLAMSSRNLLLNEKERKLAPILYDTLTRAHNLLKSKSINDIKKWAEERFSNEKNIKFEYFEILNANNLLPLQTQNYADKKIICVCIRIGKIRLIDNLLFN